MVSDISLVSDGGGVLHTTGLIDFPRKAALTAQPKFAIWRPH